MKLGLRGHVGLILGSSQFLLVPQLPKKNAHFKSGRKSDSK